MPIGAHAVRAVTAAGTCAIISIAPAWSQSQPWELLYNQEIRYISWQGTRGWPPGLALLPGSGSQLYTPLTIQLTGLPAPDLKFEFIGRGGYVNARQSTTGATGSVSTFTDTVTAATLTYLGIPGIQPFVSFNANLPSGTSALLGTATFARMDPDLVDLATFGEGWNFGPTIGFNLPVTPMLIFSLGAGHTVRGAYQRENTLVPGTVNRLDPGDVATITASLGYRGGPLTAQISSMFVHEEVSSLDGTPFFQFGNRYLVSGTANFAWTATSTSTLTASWSYTEKNKLIAPPAILVPTLEAFNSNSNVYRVRFEHAFAFGSWTAGPIVSWMLRDKNAYVPVAFQFVPAKTRWSVGGSLRYSVSGNVLLYGSVEHIWVDEGLRPFAIPPAGPIPALSYTAWLAVFGGTVRF